MMMTIIIKDDDNDDADDNGDDISALYVTIDCLNTINIILFLPTEIFKTCRSNTCRKMPLLMNSTRT